jgi:hypothetical protein
MFVSCGVVLYDVCVWIERIREKIKMVYDKIVVFAGFV